MLTPPASRPVPLLVGIRQGAARDRASDPHVVEPVGHGAQTGFDVAQALAVGELGEDHAQELVPARKTSKTTRARVSTHATLERLVRSMPNHLREDGTSLIHPD